MVDVDDMFMHSDELRDSAKKFFLESRNGLEKDERMEELYLIAADTYERN